MITCLFSNRCSAIISPQYMGNYAQVLLLKWRARDPRRGGTNSLQQIFGSLGGGSGWLPRIRVNSQVCYAFTSIPRHIVASSYFVSILVGNGRVVGGGYTTERTRSRSPRLGRGIFKQVNWGQLLLSGERVPHGYR